MNRQESGTLVGTKLEIDGWVAPHHFKLVPGEVSEYTLIGYRSKGYKEKYGQPVNVVEIVGNRIKLDFLQVVTPWIEHKDDVSKMKTEVCFTKEGTIVHEAKRSKTT